MSTGPGQKFDMSKARVAIFRDIKGQLYGPKIYSRDFTFIANIPEHKIIKQLF